MKFQGPVVRQDPRCRRFKSDLPEGKMRYTPILALRNCISTLVGPGRKVFLVCFIALVSIVALLQVGSFVTRGRIPPANTLALKWTYIAGRGWRHLTGIQPAEYNYPGLVPPFVTSSSLCPASGSGGTTNFISSSSVKRTRKSSFSYDVCLAVSVGDDDDKPNDRALPYGLLSRVVEKVKEVAASARRRPGRELPEEVKLLVGVDNGSVVCAMIRDTFAEIPGVRAQCRTFKALDKGTKCGTLVVGSSKRFVRQMPEEWTRAVEWRRKIEVDLDCVVPDHEPPAIPQKDWKPTIVTGFSSNHLTVGLLLLRSVGKAVKDSNGLFDVSIVVWAMEHFDEEHQRLLDCVIHELNYEYGVHAEVREFEWGVYPSWMRINQNLGYFGGTGEYAWKAVMTHTVLRERGMVVWCDAGDRFRGPDGLMETLRVLNSTGFVSRKSHGFVYTRTHPLMLKYFRANLPEIWDMENCEAAMVGFTLKKYRELARPWFECSMTRQCIAPDGSDRSNHRQDQSALTVLSILSRNSCSGAHPHFTHHADDRPTLEDVSGAYLTKCYVDPLALNGQGTVKPAYRPHGIIN